MATDIETLAGGYFVEVLLAIMLYGVAITQAYVYWWDYPDDSKRSRWTVIILMIMETLHTGFNFAAMYEYLIIDFNNIEKIQTLVWSYATSVVLAILIAAIVQGFLIQRIWILSKHNATMTSIPAVILLFRVSIGLVAAGYMFELRSWQLYRDTDVSRGLITCSVSLAAMGDLIIASILIFNLQQSRTGSNHTDHLIKRVQMYVVNTGALTMFVSLAIVITFEVRTGSLIFAGLIEVQCNLYTITFLATLNARQHWRSRRRYRMNDIVSMELSPRVTSAQAQGTQAPQIEILTTVSKVTDNMLHREHGVPKPLISSVVTDDNMEPSKIKILNDDY